MERRIFLFRHGQTDWNMNKRFQGHTNISLNETGREQSKRLSKFLKDYPIEKIFSSDLGRAKETAEIVASSHGGLRVETTKLLREANLGEMEGMLAQEASTTFGENVIKQWKSNEEKYLDMKFPGGESKRDMLIRVNQYLEDVVHSSELKEVGISTHGGVIHKLISHLVPDRVWDFPVTNCSLFVFQFTKLKCKFLSYHDFSKEVKDARD